MIPYYFSLILLSAASFCEGFENQSFLEMEAPCLAFEDVSFNQEELIFPVLSDEFSETVFWQISADPNFETIYAENIEDNSNKIILDESLRGSLDLNKNYYFRIKTAESSFSHPCRFTIKEPLFKESFLANSYISNNTWKDVAPFLLPANHPARPILDQIFSKSRVTANLKAMKAAGFSTKGPSQWSHTVFGKHPKLRGFVVKMVGDDKHLSEVEKFIKRIEGAKTAQEIIDRHGFNHLMKVPKKWLYALPQEPSPPPGSFRKNFILVAEDMEILKSKKNYPMWKSDAVTHELLNAVYILITEGGFNDSVQAFNIPFSEDGRLAIIDTELHHKWPIHYPTLSKFLNKEMQAYWQKLIENGVQ